MLKVKINLESHTSFDMLGVTRKRTDELFEMTKKFIYEEQLEYPELVDRLVNGDEFTDAEKVLMLMGMGAIAEEFYGASIG